VQRNADGGAKAVLRFVLHRRRCEFSVPWPRQWPIPSQEKRFTEPVALLSTQPADLPLPRAAVRRSFNLLALRARCEQEPTHASREVKTVRVWAIFDWDEAGWQSFTSDPEVPAIFQSRVHTGSGIAAGVRLRSPKSAEFLSHHDAKPEPRTGRSKTPG
jgi:hypothetical protein